MLDRSDRGDARRRGTDLARVQQTRALTKYGRDPGGRKQAPAIYLSELGPRRVVTQLKWFVSTIIVAVSGLAIIGVVIYTSMHVGDGGSMFGAMRRAGFEAMKPRAASTPGSEKPVSIGLKTDRLVISSKGLTTKNLIYEPIVQRRGTRDFITTKPYVRLVAQLALDRPEEDVVIPAFNPNDLFGNSTPIARKDQMGAELSSDPRVSVSFIDVPGGFLPREDHQELTDEEVEHAVAEADAIYAESDASLSGESPQEIKSEVGQRQPRPRKTRPCFSRGPRKRRAMTATTAAPSLRGAAKRLKVSSRARASMWFNWDSSPTPWPNLRKRKNCAPVKSYELV